MEEPSLISVRTILLILMIPAEEKDPAEAFLENWEKNTSRTSERSGKKTKKGTKSTSKRRATVGDFFQINGNTPIGSWKTESVMELIRNKDEEDRATKVLL